MNDLISRSEAVQRLIQETVDSKNNLIHINTIKRLLQDVDTVYDIDKVVEELNELDVKSITRYKNGNFGNFDGVEYYIKKRKAIEIVKQGGVSDDVCKYKIKDKMIYVSCNNKQIASAFCWFNECGDYKYCPYCGKKIKVVE